MNEQIITETHIYLDYTSGKFYNVLLTKYIGTCTLQEIKDKIDKTSKYTFPYTKFLQKMSVVSIIWQTIHVHENQPYWCKTNKSDSQLEKVSLLPPLLKSMSKNLTLPVNGLFTEYLCNRFEKKHEH